MHHTLLPIPERKALRLEYRIRALIVLCFMLSLAVMIGIAALLPSFLRASSEQRTELATVSALQKDKKASGVSDIEAELSADNALLKGISAAPSGERLSAIVQSLADARGPLSITSFEISRVASQSFSIVLQGVAPTRDALIAFKTRLEALAPGNKVELPISELADSTNVQYSIQLTESLQ